MGGSRPVTVRVPSNYRSDKPAPLLIALHGYTDSADNYLRYLGLINAANTRGYVLVAPNGIKDQLGF